MIRSGPARAFPAGAPPRGPRFPSPPPARAAREEPRGGRGGGVRPGPLPVPPPRSPAREPRPPVRAACAARRPAAAAPGAGPALVGDAARTAPPSDIREPVWSPPGASPAPESSLPGSGVFPEPPPFARCHGLLRSLAWQNVRNLSGVAPPGALRSHLGRRKSCFAARLGGESCGRDGARRRRLPVCPGTSLGLSDGSREWVNCKK